jgi:glycosyltransferase involved in cell wall biosynthesis
VAFDLPAANEIIVDGHNGLLAIPYSSESLAKKIQMLADDPLLCQQLTAQAKLDLMERFSMVRMTDEYKNFYKMVTEKYRA